MRRALALLGTLGALEVLGLSKYSGAHRVKLSLD